MAGEERQQQAELVLSVLRQALELDAEVSASSREMSAALLAQTSTIVQPAASKAGRAAASSALQLTEQLLQSIQSDEVGRSEDSFGRTLSSLGGTLSNTLLATVSVRAAATAAATAAAAAGNVSARGKSLTCTQPYSCLPCLLDSPA